MLSVNVINVVATALAFQPCFSTEAQPLAPPAPGSGLPAMSFRPCALGNNMTNAMKSRMAKTATSFIRACGFKFITSNRFTWGPQLLDCAPRLAYLLCLFARVGYEPFTDRPGHLPPRISRNATLPYNLLFRVLEIFGKDFSVSSLLCGRNQQHNRTTCYPKSHYKEFLLDMLTCSRSTLKNTLPESLDEYVFYVTYGVQKLIDSGIVKYFMG